MAEADPTALTQEFKFRDHCIKWTKFGTGPPLIFLHGTPWSSRLWAPIARCFAASFTVYLYDMPGYGESIPNLREFSHAPSYRLQTTVLVHLLSEWKHKHEGEPMDWRPHVVAHDIGGAVALRTLLTVPWFGVHLASLTLVDCGAAFPVDHSFFCLVRENAKVFKALPADLHAALLRAYVRGASQRGLRPDQEEMLVAPWLSENGQEAFYRQFEAQNNDQVAELMKVYRNLEYPLHIIWAKEDTWVPVERAHMLQEKIGGSLKIIEGAGHLVQLDAPEELTLELSQWLQRVQKAG